MHNYIYVYLDPRKPGKFVYEDLLFNFEPFYVGKGNGYRYKRHVTPGDLKKSSNEIRRGKINHIIQSGFKPLEYVIILYNELTDEDAIQKEIEVIKKIGRITTNSGPLSNLTDGGEGMLGNRSVLKGRTYESKVWPYFTSFSLFEFKISTRHNFSFNSAQFWMPPFLFGCNNYSLGHLSRI